MAREPYCLDSDVLLGLGDLQAPRAVSIAAQVQASANEMDAMLGQVYALPIELDPARADHLADILLLNKINKFLATGTIIMRANAGGEDSNLHAYGKSLYDDGMKELARIAAGRTVIEGAVKIEEEDQQSNGPIITNKDAVSFVSSFYGSKGTANTVHLLGQ